MITRKQFLILPAVGALSLALPSVLFGCSDPGKSGDGDSTEANTEYTKLTTFLFDTVIEIQADCDQETMDRLEERLVFFENTFSKTIQGSDIYAINHAQGAPTEVQPETIDIITKAIAYSELSEGLFDITVGGIINLWDFVEGTVPDPDELAEAVSHVGYHLIEIDGSMVSLKDAVTQIDLGGIAKGYITDDVAGLLRSAGCTSAFINLGGNVYALGTKAGGAPWRVGVQNPNGERGSLIGAISASDKSVVTSGINERSFTKEGVTYHHLLNPKTGMPAQTGLAGSTIISEDSLDGDAFTTITFLMGAEQAQVLLDDYPFQWVFVDTEGAIVSSPDLEVDLL